MTTTTTATDSRPEFSDETTVVLPRPTQLPPQGPAPHYPAPAGYRPGPQWGTGFPPPPYGPAPGLAQPAPARGPRISRNGLIGIAAAIALVIVMIVAVVAGTSAVSGSSQATRTEAGAPEQLIAPADLTGMLLTPETIAQLVGQPGTAAMATPKRVYTTPNDTDKLSNPACLPVAYPAEQVAYQGSGFTALATQMTVARPAKDQPQAWVYEQAVTTYPSAQAAEKFVSDSAAKWNACQNQSWSQRYESGDTAFWTSGDVSADGGVLTVLTTQENGGGWACRRGLKAHANVVMDFAVCADTLPDAVAPAIADAIAHNGRPV